MSIKLKMPLLATIRRLKSKSREDAGCTLRHTVVRLMHFKVSAQIGGVEAGLGRECGGILALFCLAGAAGLHQQVRRPDQPLRFTRYLLSIGLAGALGVMEDGGASAGTASLNGRADEPGRFS